LWYCSMFLCSYFSLYLPFVEGDRKPEGLSRCSQDFPNLGGEFADPGVNVGCGADSSPTLLLLVFYS
jgi:hypothetical protein